MKSLSISKKIPIFIIVLIAIISLIIALTPVFFGLFPFTFDQARDLLWVKNQIDFKKPSLIGPWGSLSGVYFGPLWFWLLVIPYILSGGNPITTTLFNSFIVMGSIIIAAYLCKKQSMKLSYFILLSGFLSPAIHGISQFAFSQHLLPLLSILLIYSYLQILLKGSQKHFLLSFFWIALMFHAEPPISIFSLPSLFIISYLTKYRKRIFNFKSIFLGGISFTIPFMPQIIFELRHGFIELKSAIDYFSGGNQSLGGILPFWQRVIDRPLQFFDIFRISIFQRPVFITFLILVVTFYANIKKNKLEFTRKLWQASLIYVISLLLILILYPSQIKNFYLDGVIIIFILWNAIALTNLWQEKIYQKFIILYLILAFFQNMSPIYFIKSVSKGFADKYNAGSIFANQKAVIDFIYKDANGEGFQVYTYVGPIYDYPYQYLFLWHGLKHYGYLPEEFAYLPGVPEYVQGKTQQLKRIESEIKKGGEITYLIIETEKSEAIKKWYGNFPKDELEIVAKKDFSGNISVEKRRKVKNEG